MRGTALLLATALSPVVGKIVNFETDAGAVPDKTDNATSYVNGKALNATLVALQPGDTLVIPNKTYYLMGGIRADNVRSVTIQIDGTLSYSTDTNHWPRSTPGKKGKVLECWYGDNWENVTFTSSGTGTMEGNGAAWWGFPGIGYLELGENRPRLISLNHGKNILFEHIRMHNSPYWTFWVNNVDGLEVRDCHIWAARNDDDGHGTIDITAFNTDGFDVTGRNVWIHDCSVWCQDDCIAAKDNSQDMLFERIEASGLGLTIGSIGSGSLVRNITFRDIHMHKTVKGIYTKFRGGPATIEDVLFENIVMDEPSQYPIWIGPAQQSDSGKLCAAHPCSLCWPDMPGAKCDAPAGATYINITVRNVTVNNAKGSAGVILANAASPMQNVVFEDVKFNNPGKATWQSCAHANGVARGSTFPVPPCFKDETGTCVKDGGCTVDGRTCCSGRTHLTDDCGVGSSRCGCVPAGDCAKYHTSDCCSGKGHKTAACAIGVGFRCD